MPNDVKAKLIVQAICQGTKGPEEAVAMLVMVIDEFKALIGRYEQRLAEIAAPKAAVA